jgi:hypothetical protein
MAQGHISLSISPFFGDLCQHNIKQLEQVQNHFEDLVTALHVATSELKGDKNMASIGQVLDIE